MFARIEIPEELVSDNMPFNSREFQDSTTNWDIIFPKYSPRYPHSNDIAERGVQIAKGIMRKAR